MKTSALLCLIALASTIATPPSRRRSSLVADASPTPSRHRILSRSSAHFSPVNPELTYLLGDNPGYPELAALARAAQEHRTRNHATAAFVPSPSYNPQAPSADDEVASNYIPQQRYASSSAAQPSKRPVQGDVDEQTAFVARMAVYKPRQPLRPVYHATPLQPFGALLDTAADARDANSFAAPTAKRPAHGGGDDGDDGDVASTGGSMGRLTEVIFPRKSVAQHVPTVAVVEARSQLEDGDHHGYGGDGANYAAKYEFGYAVRDARGGNFFGHTERRDGAETTGTYHVFLPDGRLQSVQYRADHTGYHAHVSYKRPELEKH